MGEAMAATIMALTTWVAIKMTSEGAAQTSLEAVAVIKGAREASITREASGKDLLSETMTLEEEEASEAHKVGTIRSRSKEVASSNKISSSSSPSA